MNNDIKILNERKQRNMK